MFDPGYYSGADLKNAGFRKLGKNVSIAKNCTIIGIKNILIGDNVRIDGYCSIIAAGTGYVELGSFIHIGGYCMLSAGRRHCDGRFLRSFTRCANLQPNRRLFWKVSDKPHCS